MVVCQCAPTQPHQIFFLQILQALCEMTPEELWVKEYFQKIRTKIKTVDISLKMLLELEIFLEFRFNERLCDRFFPENFPRVRSFSGHRSGEVFPAGQYFFLVRGVFPPEPKSMVFPAISRRRYLTINIRSYRGCHKIELFM